MDWELRKPINLPEGIREMTVLELYNYCVPIMENAITNYGNFKNIALDRDDYRQECFFACVEAFGRILEKPLLYIKVAYKSTIMDLGMKNKSVDISLDAINYPESDIDGYNKIAHEDTYNFLDFSKFTSIERKVINSLIAGSELGDIPQIDDWLASIAAKFAPLLDVEYKPAKYKERIKNKKYRDKHKEKIKQRRAAYREANREREAKRDAERDKLPRRKEQKRVAIRKHYAENRERMKARMREYRARKKAEQQAIFNSIEKVSKLLDKDPVRS